MISIIKNKRLTVQQHSQYFENGYLVYGNLLSSSNVDVLKNTYLNVLESLKMNSKLSSIRDGETRDGKKTEVFQIRAAHLQHLKFQELLYNELLLDIVEELIGSDIRLVLYQGLYKPPFTGGVVGWHQDDYYFQVNKPNAVVSCWVALDDATIFNGCMWMLPKQHKDILEHSPASGKGFEIPNIDESKAVPIELKAGQCLFHHGLTPHRTLANSTSDHRRAFSLHFMDATAIPLGKGRQEEPIENMPILRSNRLPISPKKNF
jgi:ectoine hydroxylase-related dioxygenase (phytanoyl-CoA dioxygenase family)